MHAPSATEPAPALPPVSPTTTDGRITAPALVNAAWLHEHHDVVRVLDTRSARDFAAGHLPGAVPLPLDSLLVDDSSRPALTRLAIHARAVLAARGIAPHDHVALLDSGDGTAALGAVICELAGMRRVSVVHGSGVSAWYALGGMLTTEASLVEPVQELAWDDISIRRGSIAAFEDVVDAVVHGRARLVDARSQLEHEGIIGAPCCEGRGAIPGSIHVEWTTCFDMFGAPRTAEQVVALLGQVGITPDDPLIITCHAGHRAAITARVLRASGFSDVRVSIGSWHEWAARGLGEDVDERDEASAGHTTAD